MSPIERNTLPPSGEPTSVVRRMSDLFAAFGPTDTALGVNELTRRTGIPKATVSRLVKEMEAVGFLERRGAKVGLGLRLFELGERASRRRSVREVALPFLADLREATRQTVHLAILDGTEVVYVEILPGRDAPWLPSGVGGRLPAHATGVGKALLAGSPPQVIAEVLAAGLVRVGPRTITTPGPLVRQLRRIASSGIAYEHEESAPGVACVASAIRSADGPPVAAVSASGWIGKVDIRRVGPAVHTTALSITRALTDTRDRENGG
ncbi:IclR family transcriptional regulator [Rhodococcus sp. LB1]|uniref:IclR family transcriptional regulator n=1 Tax=Rhodococcus sp. LB1 TaxID=1807499 RepID=UPI00077A3889|nr:IclR family transcriptional regulator [Rhodococcus sp. LB1]KXX56002.1 IclR family transcriptional regulator [Rhodococcus sp. LB1]